MSKNEFPISLRPDAKPCEFFDGSSKKEGALVTARPFIIEKEGIDENGESYVVKKYDFHNKEMKESLFTEKGVTLQDKAKYFKGNYEFTRNFFQNIPDLIEPTQIFLSKNEKGESSIYEVQRNVEGVSLSFVDDEDINDIINLFTRQQILDLAIKIKSIVYLVEDAVKQNLNVPDINLENFIIEPTGALRLIDTNVVYKNYEKGGGEYIKDKIESMKKIAVKIYQYL